MAVIVIDPGHAGVGIDSGAPGAVGIPESIVNLQVAKLVEQKLLSSGHQVILTRERDPQRETDSLKYRCSVSNNANADLFVSIHCNGSPNPEATGTETWYHTSSSKGRKLASKIQAKLIENTGMSDRGIKGSYSLYVLSYTMAPACLVELGFISNPKEARNLTSPTKQEILADSIYEGILEYLG